MNVWWYQLRQKSAVVKAIYIFPRKECALIMTQWHMRPINQIVTAADVESISEGNKSIF